MIKETAPNPTRALASKPAGGPVSPPLLKVDIFPGIHGYDTAVLSGDNETLSCTIDGFDDNINKSDVKWYNENGKIKI